MSPIEELMFDQPSGNVRGQVMAFATVNGKRKRVAHATLLTNGAPDIVLEVPRKVGLADIAALTAVLNDFAGRVQALA